MKGKKECDTNPMHTPAKPGDMPMKYGGKGKGKGGGRKKGR